MWLESFPTFGFDQLWKMPTCFKHRTPTRKRHGGIKNHQPLVVIATRANVKTVSKSTLWFGGCVTGHRRAEIRCDTMRGSVKIVGINHPTGRKVVCRNSWCERVATGIPTLMPLATNSGICSLETSRDGASRKTPGIDATVQIRLSRIVASRSNPVTDAPIAESRKMDTTDRIWGLRSICSNFRLVRSCTVGA